LHQKIPTDVSAPRIAPGVPIIGAKRPEIESRRAAVNLETRDRAMQVPANALAR
jgi:hypothetical protein